jgi:hypothetical protein
MSETPFGIVFQAAAEVTRPEPTVETDEYKENDE